MLARHDDKTTTKTIVRNVVQCCGGARDLRPYSIKLSQLNSIYWLDDVSQLKDGLDSAGIICQPAAVLESSRSFNQTSAR